MRAGFYGNYWESDPLEATSKRNLEVLGYGE